MFSEPLPVNYTAAPDAGNGDLLSRVGDPTPDGGLALVRWTNTSQVFFAASDQTPAAKRTLFIMPEEDNGTVAQRTMDLMTDDGKRLLRNALNELYPLPVGPRLGANPIAIDMGMVKPQASPSQTITIINAGSKDTKTVSQNTSVNLSAPQYVGSGSSRMRFDGWSGAVPDSNQSINFAFSDTTTVFQPGPEGKDTFFGTAFCTEGAPDRDVLGYGGWGDAYYDFIEFDVSTLPPADQVSKVEMQLHQHGDLRPNDAMLQVNRITESWTEADVNLSRNPDSLPYKPFGAIVAGWNVVDITDLYKDWKTGKYPNCGVKLSPGYTWESNGGFYSSDCTTATLRPKLVITTDGDKTGISVSPFSLDFGAVALGGPSGVGKFVVRNTSAKMQSGSASVAAPFAVVSGGTYSLAPGGAQTVTLSYTPTVSGVNSAWASFTTAAGVKQCQVKGQAYSTPQLGALEGTVSDAATDAPLGGALVTVGGQKGYSDYQTGKYRLQDLAAGVYTVSVSAAGYTPVTMNGVAVNPPSKVLPFMLTPSGSVPLEPPSLKDVPVVLVRGLGGANPGYFNALKAYLHREQGFAQVWDCGAVIDGEAFVVDNASNLREFLIQKSNAEYGMDKVPYGVNIVAHSMGGLITREFLNNFNLGEKRQRIRNVIMLSTPNAGSPLADAGDTLFAEVLSWWFWHEGMHSCTTYFVRNNFNRTRVWKEKETSLYLLAGERTSPINPLKHLKLSAGWLILADVRDFFDPYSSDGAVPGLSSFGAHMKSYFSREKVQSFKGIESAKKEVAPLNHTEICSDNSVLAWIENTLIGSSYQPYSHFGQLFAASNPDTSSSDLQSPTSSETFPSLRDSSSDMRLQLIELQQDRFPALGHHEYAIPSDATGQLVFMLQSQGGPVAFTLRDPQGGVIDPAGSVPGNVSAQTENDAASDMSQTLVIVTDPAQGVWTVVYDVNGATTQTSCLLMGDSRLAFIASDGESRVRQNAPVTLGGLFWDTAKATSVTATGYASVTAQATVASPDGTSSAVSLFDDGLYGDGAAGDGSWAAPFESTGQAGDYGVLYRVDGVTTTGLAFRRVAMGNFQVGGEYREILGDFSSDAQHMDNAGWFDTLRVQFLVNLKTAGTYSICGTLGNTQTTAAVSSSERLTEMPSGISRVTLLFDLSDLPPAQRSGAYSLKDLMLFQENDGMLQWRDTYGLEVLLEGTEPPQVTHQVIFQIDGTPGATLAGETSQSIADGFDASPVTAVAPTGYYFVKWMLDDATYSTSNPLVVNNLTADMAFTARFAINDYHTTHTLQIIAEHGTISRSPDLPAYEYGSTVLLTATPNEGYQFKGWSGDASGTDNPITITMDANKAVGATFDAITDNADKKYYKVSYSKAAVTANEEGSLTVAGDAKGSLKVQLQTKTPKSTAPKEGKYFYLFLRTIPMIDIVGAMNKVAIDAPVVELKSSGVIKSLTTNNNIELVNTAGIGSLKMTVYLDDKSETAATTILTTGSGDMKLSLLGVILESLDTTQSMKYIKVGSKAWKTAAKAKVTSLAGIGRVGAAADVAASTVNATGGIKSIATKGASIAPDSIISGGSETLSVSAKAQKLNKVEYGAHLGMADAATMLSVIAANMKNIFGHNGVAAILIAGANPDGTPAYSGAIKQIGAKKGVGSLLGTAHISPTAKDIKFKSDQGAFVVQTAAQ